MHDRAPCPRSKVFSEYLWKSKVKVLDWRGNRSDLNPVKNLWDYIKKKVAEKQPLGAKNL